MGHSKNPTNSDNNKNNVKFLAACITELSDRKIKVNSMSITFNNNTSSSHE